MKVIHTVTDPDAPNFGSVIEEDRPEFDPVPNNSGNPYFGKKPLPVDEFWGLVLTVYIAVQGSNAAGLDRHSRLITSKRAQPILELVRKVDLVDPDDKNGAFLKMLGILTTTDHEDGASGKLMTAQEVAGIMAAWP